MSTPFISFLRTTMSRDNEDDNQSHESHASEPDEDGNDSLDNLEENKTEEPASKKQKVHKLSLKKTSDFNEQLAQRGVVYISRIPPRMTPTKIKQLLQDFEPTRVFLQEEDPSKRKHRRKMTGNGSKRYTEGWIEFASKTTAKQVAMALNNTRMSNYKRSHHYDDLWSLKYLSKFTWSLLTEKVAYERRIREQKLRLETMQAKREVANYRNLVETGKKLDMIQDRRRKKALKDGRDWAQPEPKMGKQIAPMEEGRSSTKSAILKSLV